MAMITRNSRFSTHAARGSEKVNRTFFQQKYLEPHRDHYIFSQDFTLWSVPGFLAFEHSYSVLNVFKYSIVIKSFEKAFIADCFQNLTRQLPVEIEVSHHRILTDTAISLIQRSVIPSDHLQKGEIIQYELVIGPRSFVGKMRSNTNQLRYCAYKVLYSRFIGRCATATVHPSRAALNNSASMPSSTLSPRSSPQLAR